MRNTDSKSLLVNYLFLGNRKILIRLPPRFIGLGVFLLVVIGAVGVLHGASKCPPGYELIPELSPWSNEKYCIMTWEAVNPKTTAPWNYVTIEEAEDICDSNVPGGKIPTNSLWQAMLRQAEMVNENWTGKLVGIGAFKTDLVIPNQDGSWSKIYDVGDGLWEYVNGVGPGDFESVSIHQLKDGDTYYWRMNTLYGNAKFHFGPRGVYPETALLGHVSQRHSSHVMRGGDEEVPHVQGHSGQQGAFSAALNHSGQRTADVGFRCACPLRTCGL